MCINYDLCISYLNPCFENSQLHCTTLLQMQIEPVRRDKKWCLLVYLCDLSHPFLHFSHSQCLFISKMPSIKNKKKFKEQNLNQCKHFLQHPISIIRDFKYSACFLMLLRCAVFYSIMTVTII